MTSTQNSDRTDGTVTSRIRALARRHHLLWSVIEAPRATAELGALLACMPWLATLPRSDPYPVMVVPGLSGGWTWCAPLRTYLEVLGYDVHQPSPGSTKARLGTVRQRLCDQVDRLAQRHGAPVGLIGWSVGGCLTRQVALTHPSAIRQLITLGTPLNAPWYRAQPEAAVALSVPTAAVYSRTDAAARWTDCLQPPGHRTENIEIISSHLGMATNPMAYHVIADRLAQPVDAWRPFRPPFSARSIPR